MTITENSAPVVALARFIGWASSAPSRREDRALSASHATSQPQTVLCSHLGCAGAVVAAPHGWPLCSAHQV